MRRFVGLVRALVVPALVSVLLLVVSAAGASPGSGTTYTAAAPPVLATITNGATAAPWNEYQGDPAASAYTSQSPGTVLQTYTPGGATTSTGGITEPNLAVYPSASSGTDGVFPYPAGTVGTPGPLDGYCGSGSQATESGGTPARQPADTTLPLAPAYFPHIVRNADGTLTGYFDYRPKDATEAIVAATSTDNGVEWTYKGEALEQNQGYCPSADINDDGQGHENLITVGGNTFMYTLPRAAGDMQGVGLLIHQLTPTEANPLGDLPASEPVGIDPDAFVPAGTPQVIVTTSSSAAVPLTTVGSPGSTEQLVTGSFIDLTQDKIPGPPPTYFDCTVTTAPAGLTGCVIPVTPSQPSPASITIQPGDLIEQVLGFTSPSSDIGTIPGGPNTTNGDISTPADAASLTIESVRVSGSTGFTDPLTGSTFNNNAPNRLYLDGTAIYCGQANANPTTHIEDCTTGANNPALAVTASYEPFTSDPIVPASAYDVAAGDGMTSGLSSPDGIVGVLPSYPGTGVPAGATYVMYTEKELGYFIAADTSAKLTLSSSTPFSIASNPGPYIAQDLSASGPVTIELGASAPSPGTTTAIVTVTCTSLNNATGAFSGCLAASATYNKWTVASSSYVAAPGATTVDPTTLGEIGEGSTKIAKLYKNNEDISVLRVAWTTDGIHFSSTGLANGGVISGATNGTVSSTGAISCGAAESYPYSDINDPCAQTSPSNLNAYANNDAANGTGPSSGAGADTGSSSADSDEMRWVGSAGSIIVNPDGSYGLFLSGAWGADGDSDAFNQTFYSSSSDGEHWSVPVPVISTDYSFAASAAQDAALAAGHDDPLGISAYYSGRAYDPSVVQNPNGTLTMVFAGDRLPKSISAAGTTLGTNPSNLYTVGTQDPTLLRNILTLTLGSSTSPRVPTSVSVSASASEPTYGTPVSYTATVAPTAPGSGLPTGTVAFASDGVAISGCGSEPLSDTSPDTAICTTTPLAGMHTIAATYSGDSNYAGMTGSTSLTVEQATLTVAAQNASVTFGQPTPAFTTTISGFVNHDPSSVVTGAASCSTTRTLASSAGPYPIMCTIGTLAAANYTFVFEPGTLTVTDTETITGTVNGKLKIDAGQAVVLAPGAVVNGPVTLAAGASLDIEGASVSGPLTGDGVGTVRICGATLGGPLTLSDATGPILIGDGTSSCTATTISGPATFSGNGGGVTVIGATVGGPLRVEDNSGGVTVTNNKVGGPLTVTGNSGTVVDTPNSASGPANLQ